MKCTDCPYWYAAVDEHTGEPINNPRRHYYWNDGYAPCETED